MLIEFESHPDGTPVTVDTMLVATVRPARGESGVTIIRLSDGRDVLVKATKEQVMRELDRSGEMRARGE